MRKAEIIARPHRAGAWLTALGAAAIVIATLTPSTDAESIVQLCIVCGDRGGVDTLLNFLLFVPFGVGLGMSGRRAGLSIAVVVVTTLLIEAVQVRLVPGRDASLGDVLMNTLGGTLGVLCGSSLDLLVRPGRRAAMALAAVWAAVFVGVMLVGSYALVPLAGTQPYYGQIARDLGPEMRGFPGAVEEPRIGTHLIQDQGFAPSVVPALLGRKEGVVVSATVVPAGCPPNTVGILQVADSLQHAIVTLAQRGLDLTFGVRTGADALRLRPFRYRLERVFGERNCGAGSDAVTIAARLSSSEVVMQAVSPALRRSGVYPRRLMESWRLITPWQTFASDRLAARWVSALWTCLLVVPLAYWSRFGLAVRTAMATAAAVLVVGFVLIPLLFEVPPAGGWDWIAAGAALVVGILIGGLAADRTMPQSARIPGE